MQRQPTNERAVKDKVLTTPVVANAHSRNSFSELSFHGQAWLLGLFGTKDGTSDPKYFRMKAEITAFASEIYRTYTNGLSPKYRAAYTPQCESIGFITKKNSSLIPLETIFDVCKLFFQRDEIYFLCIDSKNDLSARLAYVKHWHEQQHADTLKELAQLTGIVSTDALDKVKQAFQTFSDTAKEITTQFVNDLYRDFPDTESFFAENPSLVAPLDTHRKQIAALFSDIVAPAAAGVTKELQALFLTNGLPEITAIAYLLGETSFKSIDLMFDTTNQTLVKLDHERCLWELSHALGVDLGIENFIMASKHINQEQSICSLDISLFPRRQFYGIFWPGNDNYFHNPKWFCELYQQEEFRQRAYATFLAVASTPDEHLRALGQLFFKPGYRNKIVEHFLARKHNLTAAMQASNAFAEFVLSYDLDRIVPALHAHNQRWHKEKHINIQINIAATKKNAKELQAYLTEHKHFISAAENQCFMLQAPSFK